MVRKFLDPVLVFSFVWSCNGLAQCAPEWAAGTPLAEVRGDVTATATWDPDGTGPLPVCLVIGGRFDVGTVTGNIAIWTGTAWLSADFPSTQTVAAMTVWNGKLVAAGSLGWLGTYDGTTWTHLGSVESYSGGLPQPGEVRSLTVYNGELIVVGSFGGIWRDPSLWMVSRCARFDGTNWNGLGAGLPIGTPYCAAVFNNSLYVGGHFDPSWPFPGPGPFSNLHVWNGTAWTTSGTWDGRIDTLAARIGTALTNSFLYAGGAFTQINGTLSAPLVARFSPSTNSWSSIGTPAAGSAPVACSQLFVRSTGLSSFEVAAVVDVPTDEKAWRLSGGVWTAFPPVQDNGALVYHTRIDWHGGRYVLGIGTTGGTHPAHGLRAHDSAAGTWPPLVGPGFDDSVDAVCVDGSETIVAGRFTKYGNAAVERIARGHDGLWQPLGGGITGGDVAALARLPNGDIVAGGDFTTAGGVPTDRIARWNGSSWSPLGAGLNGRVAALLVLPGGDLIAGGSFTTAGGSPANRIARWNGTAWSAIGAGANGDVLALALHPNGAVIAGGSFTLIGGGAANRIASWNGAAWSPLGSGLDAPVMAIAATPAGDVWAGGSFLTAGGVNARSIAHWNGSAWSPVPSSSSFFSPIVALAALPNGEIVLGRTDAYGGFCFARLRGSAWEWEVRGQVARAIVVRDDGRIVVGGELTRAGNSSAGNVATLVPTCPATALVHGVGCAGSGGTNTLTATRLPWDGAVFRSRAAGLAPSSVTLTLFGFVQALVQLSLLLPEALPGCLLLTTPDIVTLGVPSGGVLDTDVFIAPTPSLIGATIWHQVIPLEIGGSGQVSAITASNALALLIGSL